MPGVDTVVKISNVNSNGSVQSLKFISYGHGFDSTTNFFTVRLYPASTISVNTEDVKFSKTLGFSESVSVLSYDPTSPSRYFFSDYTSNTYTVSAANTASVTTSSFSVSGANVSDGSCVVTFRLGALARYPGSFSVNKGFLSEPEVCLQGDKLYQPFAYQTITDVDYAKFFDVVKKLVHPAGQRLFNNRLISSSIDITSNIIVYGSANVFAEAVDSISMVDTELSKTTFKYLGSNFTTTVDNFDIELDSNQADLAINITDSVVITTQQTYSDPTYFSQDYIQGPLVTV